MKHAVFAASYYQAEAYARRAGLEGGQWIYADRRHKLEGLDPSQVMPHLVEGWAYDDEVRRALDFLRELRMTRGLGDIQPLGETR